MKLQEIFIFLTSHRIPSIATLCIFIEAIHQLRHLGRGVVKKATKTEVERRACSQKVTLLSKILLCTFFFNLSFIPSWFLIKLRQDYSEQQKEHIQEKAYQCIWNTYIIFPQKYYNSTTLPMWVVYTHVSKISIVSKDLVFYVHWYKVIAIYAKNLIFSHSIVF